MAQKCPNCGQPTRTGARFCGFCGTNLGATDPEERRPDASPNLRQASPKKQNVSYSATTNPCHFCGSYNRPGVKFCASCGRQLSSNDIPPVPPPLPQTEDRKIGNKRSRLTAIGILAGVLVIICVSLIIITQNLGLYETIFPKGTSTEVGIELSDLTNTPVDPTQIPSSTQEPTNTSVPTPTPSPTETSFPTVTHTPTPKVIFQDHFDQGLGNWEPWGSEGLAVESELLQPQVILDDYLELKGYNYDQVGVTSIQTYTLVSGMVFDFKAEVENPIDANLFFDWYPGNEIRSPDELGPIYLEIRNSETVFHYISNGKEIDCRVPLPEPGMRTYRLVFGADWELILLIGEGNLDEVCRSIIDQPDDLFGRITFSGFGLVDRVSVTQILP